MEETGRYEEVNTSWWSIQWIEDIGDAFCLISFGNKIGERFHLQIYRIYISLFISWREA